MVYWEVTDHTILSLGSRWNVTSRNRKTNIKIGQNWASHGYRLERMHGARASRDPCREPECEGRRERSWALGATSKLGSAATLRATQI